MRHNEVPNIRNKSNKSSVDMLMFIASPEKLRNFHVDYSHKGAVSYLQTDSKKFHIHSSIHSDKIHKFHIILSLDRIG